MLKNPLHLRLEKLASWQHLAFMLALCERMYPNYALFCQQTGFGNHACFRQILDLGWESIIVKEASINFDHQLEKFAAEIPLAEQYDVYGVYPAIDACVGLCELLHACLSGETLQRAIAVSDVSVSSVAMLAMTETGAEMSDEQLNALPAIEQEWDIQWEIYRLLLSCEQRDITLLRGLRAELRDNKISNIGIFFEQ